MVSYQYLCIKEFSLAFLTSYILPTQKDPTTSNEQIVGIYKIVPKIPVSITAVLVFYTL